MNNSFGMSISNMCTCPQLMLTDTISFSTSNYTSLIPKLATRANLENHGANKKSQTTAFNKSNKVTGGEHVLKENSHTTEDKMKGNTHLYINKAQPEYFEKEHITRVYEESDAYIYVKGNLNKHIPLRQNTTKVNKTVCGVLKYGS